MIIGTAGHVDHGKTALIRSLTGVDGDRLKEERARGVTIDLGFAYLPTPDGAVLGFVDVPGHERFVHTMLAGAGGIDYALMVIAADDGIKPQTCEHLAIIELLGIRRGLVALTKADLVGPERVAMVCADIKARFAGTVLAAAEIVPVCAPMGTNIEALRSRLVAAAAEPTERPRSSRFRLAVDRVFTLHGIGLVVTGTVLSGAIHVDDKVVVSPSGLPARVRSLHAQNLPSGTAYAGERCALNLLGAGISQENVRRGDVVLDPALHAPTDRIDATLTLLPDAAKPVGQWFAVRLHHAATEVGARLVLLRDEPLPPGGRCDVQLILDRPIAAAAGDRYVIRDAAARCTVGGGRFVDLRPPQRRRRTAERQAQRAALTRSDPAAAFGALLMAPPFVHDLGVFGRDRALSAGQVETMLEALEPVLLADGSTRLAMAALHWKRVESACCAVLTDYHASHPDHQGIGRERLRLAVEPRLPAAIFPIALHRMTAGGEIAMEGSFVRFHSHRVCFAPGDEEAWNAIVPLLGGQARFRPPRVRDIAAELAQPEGDVRRLMKLARRMGLTDEVAHDHFFLRKAVHEMVGAAAELSAEVEGGAFTAAQFRDRLANGRKVAIQILDFLDQHGITLRTGDLRRVDDRRLDMFAG